MQVNDEEKYNMGSGISGEELSKAKKENNEDTFCEQTVQDPNNATPDFLEEDKSTNYEFSDFKKTVSSAPPKNIEFLLDVPLEVTVELGRTKMLINDLLGLGQSSVIELSKHAGEPLEILVNQKLIARGEVVVVKEKYGVRLTEVLSPKERIENLK